MEKINVNEITNDLEAKGIKVIPITYTKSHSISLKGDLEDFIVAAKAFGENVVFMAEFLFDNESFFHEPDAPILGEYDQPPTENGINLTQFLPELENFKSYISEISFLVFRVFYRNQSFDYLHYAGWYKPFNDLLEEAERIFEEKERVVRDQQIEQENAEREEARQRQEFLRTLLEELGNDDKFASLRTQKAMQEYATARYPELNELTPNNLKVEISNLLARIQARKILQ